MGRVYLYLFVFVAAAVGTCARLPAQADPDVPSTHVKTMPAPPDGDGMPALRVKQIPAPGAGESAAAFSAEQTNPLSHSIQIISEAEMSRADRDLVADAQSSIQERAGFENLEFDNGGWTYRELVCPALPNHLFLRFTRDDGTRHMSMFSASIPRDGNGRVHIILKPLRDAYPGLVIELWEDQTHVLVDSLRNHRLDAAVLATPSDSPEITEIPLFEEPLLAALPPGHRFAGNKSVSEKDLAQELLVLADGHCLANQALAACGARAASQRTPLQASMQAATLETLVNLVAAGYGSTLVPALAAGSLRHLDIVLLPLTGDSSRTIRLASRPGFPRPQALRALEKIIRSRIGTPATHSGTFRVTFHTVQNEA
jgi:hypothetical protein